jgi:hypothetical protein
LNPLCGGAAARDDARMQGNFRNSTVARIGRSYPRPSAENTAADRPRRVGRGFRITGTLLIVLSALGFLGWLIAR